jgi:hypothetical protein
MKAKKASTRLLGILPCCLLTIGLLPITAFAAESGFSRVLIGSKNITVQETATLTSASGGKITWDSTTGTLTLENANLRDFNNDPKYTYGIWIDGADTSNPETLTVILKGTNYIGDDTKTALYSALLYKITIQLQEEGNIRDQI